MHLRKLGFVILFAILFFSPRVIFAQYGQNLIKLSVIATEVPRKILHVSESISVKPGMLSLLYPKWIPGDHAPTGPVIDLVGLRITANGSTIKWRRDLENMFSIHCTIPDSISSIEVSFDYILKPLEEPVTGASSTEVLFILNWNQVILYPDAPKPDEIIVSPEITLPGEWKYVSSLEKKDQSGNTIRFMPVSLTMLIDSPLLAGVHLKRIDITPPSGVPHFLNICSDNEAALDIKQAQINAYKQLIIETNALFGNPHYRHYDFLYTLSDQVKHSGIEHHQSSDNRDAERMFLDYDQQKHEADRLTHELVHSWNGKYRRPEGLATGDFSTPMHGDLLWIYEGLTEYLGEVLAARSGLWTQDDYFNIMACEAARLDNRPGRTWRPLQDANDEAQLLYDSRMDWDSWRRSVDFYDEGKLIWLEADVIMRQLSNGTKSLDDFCRIFFGGENNGPEVKSYVFNDVLEVINRIVPYDWRTFFAARLQSLDVHAPINGIINGGWKLIFRETPNEMQKIIDASHRRNDFRYSLGILVEEDGTLDDIIPGSEAYKAGLAPGMKLIAVNGRKFSSDIMKDAMRLAKNNTSPIELLAVNGEFYKPYAVDYHGGERYPFLERDSSKSDLLSIIIGPHLKILSKQEAAK